MRLRRKPRFVVYDALMGMEESEPLRLRRSDCLNPNDGRSSTRCRELRPSVRVKDLRWLLDHYYSQHHDHHDGADYDHHDGAGRDANQQGRVQEGWLGGLRLQETKASGVGFVASQGRSGVPA